MDVLQGGRRYHRFALALGAPFILLLLLLLLLLPRRSSPNQQEKLGLFPNSRNSPPISKCSLRPETSIAVPHLFFEGRHCLRSLCNSLFTPQTYITLFRYMSAIGITLATPSWNLQSDWQEKWSYHHTPIHTHPHPSPALGPSFALSAPFTNLHIY